MTSTVNGEITIDADGEAVPLRLTLAALAEIEEALGAESLVELAERLATPSAGQLVMILRALSKGAGAADPDAVAAAKVNLGDVLRAVTVLFREVLTGEVPGKGQGGKSAGAGGS